jgi:acetyl esterase/lipase
MSVLKVDLHVPDIIQTNPSIGERGEIHVYRPLARGSGNYPFVLGIHGGAWKRGDQTAYRFLPPKLLPQGVAVVLVSYRLLPNFRFPAAFEDLAHVLAWLKRNGRDLGLNVSRCVLFGGSAGAHLAMLLAARTIAEGRTRPTLCGIVAYCGIMDTIDQYLWDQENGESLVKEFLGTSPEGDVTLYRQASPVEQVHSVMPPVWMVHGNADRIVSPDQSRKMRDKLQELGHVPILLEAQGMDHTLVELGGMEETPESLTLLFEQELLLFISRALLTPSLDL